jgi:hypothetical protein
VRYKYYKNTCTSLVYYNKRMSKRLAVLESYSRYLGKFRGCGFFDTPCIIYHKLYRSQLIRSVYCMFIVCIILNKVANAFSNKHTNIPVLSVLDSRIPRFPDSPIPGFPIPCFIKIAQLLLVRPANV